MLFKTFFVQMTELPVMLSVVLTPEEARKVFSNMSTIQAFFGGLVAGKMGEGTVSAA